jgi:hypothetical protein
MPFSAGPNIAARPNLVFEYDLGDVQNSYKGEPTTNLVPSPYDYSTYAYVSGPVNTTVLNETGNTITSKRYTVTNAINVARAAIYPVTTTNTNYTFSFKWKYNGSTTATPTFTVSAAKGNPETANNSFNSQSTTTAAIGNGWYLTVYTFNFSSNPTSGCILTFGLNTGGTASYVGETYDIYQAQFELKDHKTQYVLGTRSNTQGLLDVSGQNTTINLVNMSYTSTAGLLFNGTTTEMHPTTIWSYLSSSAMECVFNSATVSGKKTVFGYAQNDGYSSPTIGSIYLDDNTLNASVITATQVYRTATASTTIAANTFYHVVLNKDTSGGNLQLYLNGTLSGTQTFNAATYGQWSTPGNYIGSNLLDIGKSTNTNVAQGWSTSALSGSIPITRIYNQTLSAQEVLRNYNQLKTRFNLQ